MASEPSGAPERTRLRDLPARRPGDYARALPLAEPSGVLPLAEPPGALRRAGSHSRWPCSSP